MTTPDCRAVSCSEAQQYAYSPIRVFHTYGIRVLGGDLPYWVTMGWVLCVLAHSPIAFCCIVCCWEAQLPRLRASAISAPIVHWPALLPSPPSLLPIAGKALTTAKQPLPTAFPFQTTQESHWWKAQSLWFHPSPGWAVGENGLWVNITK